MDYWHQHAICTVIRHLSFTQNLVHYPEVSSAGVDELHQQVLLDTLTFLLGRTVRPSVQIPERRYQHFAITSHQVGLWLAARQGIRAGPLNTSLSVS
ncbi:MAG: Secretion monitor [Candidatus Erwinia impunctatus]|nr:Secretion monitor [Culicoides impunctatus]